MTIFGPAKGKTKDPTNHKQEMSLPLAGKQKGMALMSIRRPISMHVSRRKSVNCQVSQRGGYNDDDGGDGGD
jgi:hypothetical protein